LEWYFSEVGLLSASVFHKDIDAFISNGVIPGGVPVDVGGGETEIFDATGPINGDGGTVKGFEFGYQQVFEFLPEPFDGLGMQFNYTYTDSDVDIPYIEGDQTFAMPLEGLSKDSLNFVAFFERERFSMRVAYNYRDTFLSNRANTQGNPVFTDEYGQWDASANFNLTDNITLSINAINLNNEARYQYFLTPNRMLAHRASGRRFAVGLRARF
jgi:TonB-dependent receptor